MAKRREGGYVKLHSRDPGETFELDKKLVKPFQNRSDVIGFTMKKKVLIWQNMWKRIDWVGGAEEVGRIGRPEPVEDPETQGVLFNFSSWAFPGALTVITCIHQYKVHKKQSS